MEETNVMKARTPSPILKNQEEATADVLTEM